MEFTEAGPPAIRSRWMHPKATAEYTGFTPATLAAWRCHGGGPPFHKIGSRIRYDVEAVDAWISARTFANTSQYPTLAVAA